MIGDLAVQLSPDEFVSPPHRAAYAAAVSLARRQIPPDCTTLSEELAAQGSLGDQIVQDADSVIALYLEKDETGGSRTFIPILERRNYGRPAGEALEIVWSRQKYMDPHPAQHYRNLLRAPVAAARC